MTASHKRGFTLIELLVVIAIIGLLASVILASLNTARAKGRDARRTADVKQIQLANELYFDASSSYASSTAQLAPTYISAIPTDPSNSAWSYAYVGLQGSATNPVCGSYHLGAKLENTTASALTAKANKAVGGAYPAADGTVCTNSAWGVQSGNPIQPSSSDFDGTASGVYDVRP